MPRCQGCAKCRPDEFKKISVPIDFDLDKLHKQKQELVELVTYHFRMGNNLEGRRMRSKLKKITGGE